MCQGEMSGLEVIVLAWCSFSHPIEASAAIISAMVAQMLYAIAALQ